MFAWFRSFSVHACPQSGQLNLVALRASACVDASCQPIKCSRSGVTHWMQSGQGRAMRLFDPVTYFCQVRPASVLTVHSR